jgi:hypothetical protein
VREGQLGIAHLVDSDDEGYATRWAPHREWLPDVLVRDGIHDLEVVVGTALYDAAAELHLLVRIVEIHDRHGDSGIAARVASLQRPVTRAHEEVIALAS